jgi:hypothetical protein
VQAASEVAEPERGLDDQSLDDGQSGVYSGGMECLGWKGKPGRRGVEGHSQFWRRNIIPSNLNIPMSS